MHLLLPPSEAKTTGGRGRPLAARPPADDGLTAARNAALSALLRLVEGDPARAAEALLLPPGVAESALRANRDVLRSRTTPALRRYAGVVYDGLGYDSLAPDEQRRAARSCLVFSGLFGVVRGDEAVPEYRVPAKAVLPGLGIAGTFWRPVLDDVLPALVRTGVVVDLRSGDYASMWRPRGALADRVVPIRVLSPAPRGGHAVISYDSKIAKGWLARELIRRRTRGEHVHGVEDVAAAWENVSRAADAVTTPTGLDLYLRPAAT